MAVYLCHEQPHLVDFDATIIDARPGAVALSRSALHPGGGGQVSDLARLVHRGGEASITGVSVEGDVWWHVLDDATAELTGDVVVHVDVAHRSRVAQLHTDSHILNALVFERWAGTLVTGAQINGDGTGRMDFDLSEVDNDALRALARDVNEVIRAGVDVQAVYVDATEAATNPGLLRSLSVAPPPTPDGRLRVIDIAGIDRQACGGTHLDNTGESNPFRITKIESKGKRNRRVRFALDG